MEPSFSLMGPGRLRRSRRRGAVPVRKHFGFLKPKSPSVSLTGEWEIFRGPELQMMREQSTVPRLPNLA